jgi:hypothetical protein
MCRREEKGLAKARTSSTAIEDCRVIKGDKFILLGQVTQTLSLKETTNRRSILPDRHSIISKSSGSRRTYSRSSTCAPKQPPSQTSKARRKIDTAFHTSDLILFLRIRHHLNVELGRRYLIRQFNLFRDIPHPITERAALASFLGLLANVKPLAQDLDEA